MKLPSRCRTVLRYTVAFLVIGLGALLGSTPLGAQHWTDPAVEAKIDELMARMTLAEKIGQLNQYSSNFDITGPAPEGESQRLRHEQLRTGLIGSMLNVNGAAETRAVQEAAVTNSRLGIPLIFGYDTIHGYQTMFPVPLAETASWDLEAIELSARIAATEAAAAGLHWTFAPMVDISRDSRWGRIMEGSGEDPYLTSVVAAARVRGFQGDDLAALDTLAACAKHFAGYGLAEAGRDYNTVDISQDTLHNVVLPPFHAAVEAGVATLMNAFNEIGGTPATSSVYLQRDILKRDWGFDGFVVSDWGSIGELIPHGVAGNLRDAARLAIQAGSDMDMESAAYVGHLADLHDNGDVRTDLIDDAVRRILRIKFHLGLFEDPYRYSDVEREKRVILSDEHMAASREVAKKSIVLLKNDGVLPLKKSGTLAVIGPLAADKDAPLGSWRAKAITDSAVSLLEGLQAVDGVTVRHAQGAALGVGEKTFVRATKLNTDDRSGFKAAVKAARGADTVIMALGEEAFQTGEGRSQVEVGLKGVQMDLLREVLAVNKNVVVVLMNGRPMAIPEVVESVPALVEAWHLGSQAGHAIADVLFGDYNPSGKLPASFPRHVGQEPLYYNYRNTGRPGPSDMVFWSHYTDMPNTPLFPFGFGLSYTTFSYGEPSLSTDEIHQNGEVQVTVKVTNSGDRDGTEIVQLYVRDLVGTATRPVKELKGFERVELKAGESRDVTFTLTAKDLAYYTPRGIWEAEPGEFDVFVGTNSVDVQSVRFTLR